MFSKQQGRRTTFTLIIKYFSADSQRLTSIQAQLATVGSAYNPYTMRDGTVHCPAAKHQLTVSRKVRSFADKDTKFTTTNNRHQLN